MNETGQGGGKRIESNIDRTEDPEEKEALEEQYNSMSVAGVSG